MKNISIVELIGLTLFSATFLSPMMETSIQKKAPLLHTTTETVRQTMLIIPRILSKTETIITKFLVSIQQTKTRGDDSPYLTDTIMQIAEAYKKDTTPVSSNVITQTRQTNLKKTSPNKEQQETAGITTPTDILIYHAKTDTALYFPNEKEQSSSIESTELNPPTFYIDAVVPKELTISSSTAIISTSQEAGIDSYPEELLQRRITKLKNMSVSSGFSGKYALMINLGLKSGKKRFHIIDLEKEQIIESGLVAHGKGKEKFTLRKKYSNTNGSSCSSLGIYKIGGSYTGSFGKSYRLIGMEKSNSNALSRAIVLHAMGCIPDEEIDYPICQSEGCPSVSVSFLETIGQTISKTTKPVLLWVFDPLVDNL